MSPPVQVIVVGFDEPRFSGEVLAELTRLREAGVVRLVDVLLVQRDAAGTFHTLPSPPGAPPGAGEVAADLLGGGTDDAAAGEGGWSLTDVVAPGGCAAVALIEHSWAGALVTAIHAAGARPLGEMWLSPEDRARIPDAP